MKRTPALLAACAIGALLPWITPAMATSFTISEASSSYTFAGVLSVGFKRGFVVLCEGAVGADKMSCDSKGISDIVQFTGGVVNGIPAFPGATYTSDPDIGAGGVVTVTPGDNADSMGGPTLPAGASPVVYLAEVLNAAGTGIDYSPRGNDPGAGQTIIPPPLGLPNVLDYLIVSDVEMPEPPGLALLAGFVTMLGLARWKRVRGRRAPT